MPSVKLFSAALTVKQKQWFPRKSDQTNNQGWIGLCSVLRPLQHSIGYMGDGF